MIGVSRNITASLLACAVMTAAGCATVGPDYKRPPIETPDAFRGLPPDSAGTAQAVSIGDEQWSTIFTDDTLRGLITSALHDNDDVKIAASRIVQAEARFGIARSNKFPAIDAQALVQGQRTSVGVSDGQANTVGIGQVGATAAWELDFWGKYRRATESARAQILATEWGRRAVVASLVSEVATSYYTLLSLDNELSIATRTLAAREESQRLTQIRESGGATSLIDVRQAEQLVQTARATIVDLQRAIEQEENFLSVLVGRDPGPIDRGRPLTEQPHPPEVPAGLPSALLERRPDIQQAEQMVVAANADIGVARAQLFPRVALTGSGGLASTALSALLSGPAAAWTAAASVVQPLFNAGRNTSAVALTEAQREETILEYRQSIRNALREVSDSLVGYRRARDLRDTQALLVRAAADARRLAEIRYQGGAASYLEVLDSETRLFSAELALARAQLGELTAFVEIYRALGGGWLQ